MRNQLLHHTEDSRPQANLYQRPGDRRSKPLRSHNEGTHNLVLKITVPRMKMARHESRGFEPQTSNVLIRPDRIDSEHIARLSRCLADNKASSQIEVIGVSSQTHRFRSLPDFVKSSGDGPFMEKMTETILPFDYQKIKNFKLDMSKGIRANTEIIPPPRWSKMDVPFNYSYRQNPGVSTGTNLQGQLVTKNLQVPPKIHSQLLSFDSSGIPTGPSSELPSVDSLEPAFRNLIAAAQKVVDERLIVTRRCLLNLIPKREWQHVGQNVVKLMFQYVGYFFASGPWRDALVRFGVDPRTDPKYRMYQTLMFLVEPDSTRIRSKRAGQAKREITEQELRGESHIFDGQQLSRDGKVWQICDISDPLLSDLFSTEYLRETCHLSSDGWFHNGTMAKGRVIMRKKITAIVSGNEGLSDTQYARVAASVPDIVSKNDQAGTLSFENLAPEERALVSLIRAQCFQWQRQPDDFMAVDERDERNVQADLEDEEPDAEPGASDNGSSGTEEMLNEHIASTQ